MIHRRCHMKKPEVQEIFTLQHYQSPILLRADEPFPEVAFPPDHSSLTRFDAA